MMQAHAAPPARMAHEEQVERITQHGRIAELLTRLHRARALLSVKIPGHADSYSSAVLKVMPEQGCLLLDELYPAPGHQLFLHSARAAIQGRLNGALIEFDADLLDTGRHAAIAFYRIALPGRLRYTQRRRAYRVTLDAGQAVPLSIGAPGEGLYRGVLHDLSVSGIGAQFAQHAPPRLQQGQVLSNCLLQLSPSRQLNSQIEVRFLSHDRFYGRTRLGGCFIGLEAVQQQLVERAVAALERNRRRQGEVHGAERPHREVRAGVKK